MEYSPAEKRSTGQNAWISFGLSIFAGSNAGILPAVLVWQLGETPEALKGQAIWPAVETRHQFASASGALR
jgi:hypothetical protein